MYIYFALHTSLFTVAFHSSELLWGWAGMATAFASLPISFHSQLRFSFAFHWVSTHFVHFTQTFLLFLRVFDNFTIFVCFLFSFAICCFLFNFSKFVNNFAWIFLSLLLLLLLNFQTVAFACSNTTEARDAPSFGFYEWNWATATALAETERERDTHRYSHCPYLPGTRLKGKAKAKAATSSKIESRERARA